MKCILIDTSARRLSVSLKPTVSIYLLVDGKVVGTESWLGDKTLGTKLLSVVDELLKTNALQLSDIDRVAVHGGPGHYSALRTGITAATFLAMGADLDLVQVSGSSEDELIKQALVNPVVKVITPKYE